MKTVSIILSSITVLMALSQLICGLWMQANGADASNIAFHTKLGIGTVVIALITITAMLVTIFKH